MSAIIPVPRIAVTVRQGTAEDLPFIDALQSKQTRQLGWMPRKQLEGKIALGHVLVAESDESKEMRDERRKSGLVSHSSSLSTRLGYVIGTDRYFKREDCGIIYQLCVEEGARRGLVGAMLVKAMFDRAAYGCRLFCCWCAQDIEANKFWESLGFVPLAFRAGSARKSRVHIFWQKRIRPGDESTPWWFPSQTTGGSIRQDRLVLPIPPGTHWSDAKPIVLPQEPKALPAPRPVRKWIDPIAHLTPAERRKLPVNITSGLRFMVPAPEPVIEKKPAPKNDPV